MPRVMVGLLMRSGMGMAMDQPAVRVTITSSASYASAGMKERIMPARRDRRRSDQLTASSAYVRMIAGQAARLPGSDGLTPYSPLAARARE
jgi:hypothetical protein